MTNTHTPDSAPGQAALAPEPSRETPITPPGGVASPAGAGPDAQNEQLAGRTETMDTIESTTTHRSEPPTPRASNGPAPGAPDTAGSERPIIELVDEFFQTVEAGNAAARDRRDAEAGELIDRNHDLWDEIASRTPISLDECASMLRLASELI